LRDRWWILGFNMLSMLLSFVVWFRGELVYREQSYYIVLM
jgi:hypothetical protein